MTHSLTFDETLLETGIARAKAGLDVAKAFAAALLADGLYEIARETMIASQNRLAPQNRSQKLSQSAFFEVPVLRDGWIVLRMGYQAPHATIRDQGGIIRPVRADVLAIPQPPILDGNGESKYANPRQEPKLFVLRIPRLNFAGLAMKVNGKLEIHWVFAHQVIQKGSKYFTGTVEERRGQMGAIAGQLVKEGLEQGRAA